METEIMTNEEFIEETEEVVKAVIGKKLKLFGAGVVTVIVGGVTYKYVIKPVITNIKAKRAAKKAAKEYDDEPNEEVTREFKIVENEEI